MKTTKPDFNLRKIFAAALAGAALVAAAAGPQLVGHRGCNIGVENTADAFRNGIARGYRYIETDVRVSADTAMVLSHDTDTRRLGGNLEVASATLAELRAETYTQTRGDSTYTARICTLGEYLDICREGGVRPVIELKWATGINSDDCSLIPALMDTIAAAGMTDRAIILTSMRPCLEYIRANYPDMELQFLGRTGWTDRIAWCDSLRLHPDIAHDFLTPEAVERCHRAGLYVNSWTVDDPARADSLAAMGVDFITTNRLEPR